MTMTVNELKTELATFKDVKVFSSTLNSKGKMRISVMRGEELVSKNTGEKVAEIIVNGWNRVPDSFCAEVIKALSN